jgi:hypothetical protein
MRTVDNSTGECIYESKSFHSGAATEIIAATTDLSELYSTMVDTIKESFATFLQGGSGWQLHKVQELVIAVSKYDPLFGSSCVELPKCISNKKAVINMKNYSKKNFSV